MEEPRFRPKPSVIETDLEHELILLDPESGEMFSLNGTGRVVWHRLPGATAHELTQAVVDRFEIEPESAQRDVSELLRQLLEAGLVVNERDGERR